jgi:hypothetical protein
MIDYQSVVSFFYSLIHHSLIHSLSLVAGEVKKEEQNHSQLKILWHKKY